MHLWPQLEDPGENELLASTVVRRSYENGFSGISPTASVHNFQQGKVGAGSKGACGRPSSRLCSPYIRACPCLQQLIRVLCYNLHLRPPQFNAAVPEHKDARLAHFLREHVAHFDIIGARYVRLPQVSLRCPHGLTCGGRECATRFRRGGTQGCRKCTTMAACASGG